MINHLLIAVAVLSLSKLSSQISTKDDPSYIGAVVEYHPITDGDDGQIIAEANVNNYRTIIRTAASYAVDIIVFPEFGVTSIPSVNARGKAFNASDYRAYYRTAASLIPDPKANEIPCDAATLYAQSLKEISCAAREYSMYVVVNHHERVECPSRNCSPDGFLLYNTNVAFDRQGRLIARYRKYNLLEIGTNATREPVVSTFSTDFGVTFGQLVGFDLLKESPAVPMIGNPNVTDLVLSSRLYNEQPFLDSVQRHAAWAYAADVNLLAAAYNSDLKGSGGSGIYAGKRGQLRVYHPGVPSNALVVAEIPKLSGTRAGIPRQGRSSLHVFKQAEVPTISSSSAAVPKSEQNHTHEDLAAYTSLPVDPKQSPHIVTLCDNGLCCEFHVETKFDEDLAKKQDGSVYYRYRFAVFSGVRQFAADQTLGVEVCSIVSCAGDEIDKCGRLYPEGARVVEPTVFLALYVTRRADLGTRSFYSPTTATRELLPINTTDFGFAIGGPESNSLLLAYLSRPTGNVAAFGIYGRRFDWDGQPPTRPSSAGTSVAPSVVVVAMMLLAVTTRCFERY
ncbi:vanin-like protein 2 [Copidosoma floridanum]|uniref:vanin-like protein 2 n=1 Tax=Copidosoma floridanum TaxID=29053 RepID=UPI0006C9C741|nr:vanin-like protein 2 [Copidosoma floridanum]